MSEQRMPLIQVEHLKKYYPISALLITPTVFNIPSAVSVSFSVPSLATLGLVCDSVCGKSTIVRPLV